jgi:hypothetical protein
VQESARVVRNHSGKALAPQHQVQSLLHRRKGCCLFPEVMSGVHLHSLFEGWCLIRERYFLIRQDALLAAQELCNQTTFI